MEDIIFGFFSVLMWGSKEVPPVPCVSDKRPDGIWWRLARCASGCGHVRVHVFTDRSPESKWHTDRYGKSSSPVCVVGVAARDQANEEQASRRCGHVNYESQKAPRGSARLLTTPHTHLRDEKFLWALLLASFTFLLSQHQNTVKPMSLSASAELQMMSVVARDLIQYWRFESFLFQIENTCKPNTV